MKLTAAQQEAAYEAQQGRDHAPFQRWQHGSAWTATDGTQHVASTVAALRKSGKIGDPEVAAAARFYADYAFGIHGAMVERSVGSGGAPSPDGYSVARVDAITHYREAVRGVGAFNADLVEKVVIHEMSVTALVGSRSRRPNVAQVALVAAALKTLSCHYAKQDGAVPAPASRIRALGVAPRATISS